VWHCPAAFFTGHKKDNPAHLWTGLFGYREKTLDIPNKMRHNEMGGEANAAVA